MGNFNALNLLMSLLIPGVILGEGTRSYTVIRMNSDNIYLRGHPDGQRGESSAGIGAQRIIPTQLVVDLLIAVNEGVISIEDVYREYRSKHKLPSVLTSLGLDYDPFIMGYDSTIYKIIEYIIKNKEHATSPSQSSISPFPKPFLLLAGISGTGKTRWVIERAAATCKNIDEKENIEIIPVRPDWHEPSDLLGYTSRITGKPEYVVTDFLAFLIKAWRHVWAIESTLHTSANKLNEMVPFWLCLDEMNLAPVEQYFADYLSVLELRKWDHGVYSCDPLISIEKNSEIAKALKSALHIADGDPLWTAFESAKGIPLPPNLIVVGTVNMDETTHSFSRKVLDRALTIEFDTVQFESFEPNGKEASDTVPWHGLSAITDARELNDSLDEGTRSAVLELLKKWNDICADTPFRIAYRTINESLLIASSLGSDNLAESLDWIIMTKLLPRLEGDERKLAAIDGASDGNLIDRLRADWEPRFADDSWAGSRSARKLSYMSKRLEQTGYTSFWP